MKRRKLCGMVTGYGLFNVLFSRLQWLVQSIRTVGRANSYLMMGVMTGYVFLLKDFGLISGLEVLSAKN